MKRSKRFNLFRLAGRLPVWAASVAFAASSAAMPAAVAAVPPVSAPKATPVSTTPSAAAARPLPATLLPDSVPEPGNPAIPAIPGNPAISCNSGSPAIAGNSAIPGNSGNSVVPGHMPAPRNLTASDSLTDSGNLPASDSLTASRSLTGSRSPAAAGSPADPSVGDARPAPRLLTVGELFDLGVRNSLRLQASLQETEIAADRVKDARAGYYPALTVGINAGYAGDPVLFRRGLKNASASHIPNWQQQYDLELTQPLFTGGRLKRNVEKTKLQQKIAGLSLHAERADVKLELISHYLDLFDLYQQQTVLQKNIEESERRLHDIRQMRKEGMITRNDVIRSELELSGYRLAWQETNDNIGLLSQQLDIALGLDETGRLLPDTAFLQNARPLLAYEEYVQRAYRQAPGLRISRLNVSLAENDVRLARTAYLPDLSLRAGNTLARPVTRVSPVQDLFADNWNVALVLSYRLSSFYRDKYQVSAARRQAAAGRTREELQKQQIRVRIRSAFVHHRESLDRIRTLAANVEQAEENYRIVQNKYLNHLAILTDLLDAARVRLDAELQLTSARTEAIYTYYQLLHDTGEL